MASSIHTSLQGDVRAFRLLILEPSTDRLAPVRCMLNRASFDNDDLKYTALSYVWADPPGTTPIIVNGVETQITLNLEAALRHLRQPACAKTLWVDALCINQEDIREKNHQVEMMGEIYSGAELVIAWLGRAGEDSDLAMELLGKGLKGWVTSEKALDRESVEEEGPDYPGSSKIDGEQGDDTPARIREGDLTTPPAQSVARIPCLQLSSPDVLTKSGFTRAVSMNEYEHQDECHIIDQPGPFPTSRPSTSRYIDSAVRDDDFSEEDFIEAVQRLTKREALAILKLLKRSWWYRVWVVQEVMLAKKVVFKCGDAEVSGHKMSSWGFHLQFFHVLPDKHEIANILSPIYLLENLQDPRDNEVLMMLLLHGMREATRPHDHIYGLLGAISAEDRRLLGVPDYGCRVEDLFIDVATRLMKEFDDLELLLAAGIPKSLADESSAKMNLPSWVPDWTRPLLHINVIENMNRPKPAPSFTRSPFQLSENMKELTFHGFELGKIESVKSMPAVAQGDMPMWKSALMTEKGTRGDGRPPPLQGLLVAMFSVYWNTKSLDDEREFPMVASFFRELEEYHISLGCYEVSGDRDNYDYLAGLLDWIGETRDGRTEKEILEKIFSVEFANSFATWYHRQSSAALQRLYMLYKLRRNGALGNAGLSMFRTCKGSFGIMEAAAAAGDLLCAVPDCALPLVLRKFGSSKHLLVGPTGLIDGTSGVELTRAMEDGGITKESFTVV